MQRRKFLVMGGMAAVAAALPRILSARTVVAAIYDETPNRANTITEIESVRFTETIPVYSRASLDTFSDEPPEHRIGTARLERDGNRIVAHVNFDRPPLVSPAFPCLWGNADLSTDENGVNYRRNMRIDLLVFEGNGNIDERIQPL